MIHRDPGLEPEFESLLRPSKITRQAPPELRLRALARARAFVTSKGVIVPPAPQPLTLVSIPSAPRRVRRTIAFAAALVAAAGTAGALAALHARIAEPTPMVTPVSTVGTRAPATALPRSPAVSPRVRSERAPRPRSAVSNRSSGFERRYTAELELLQRAQVAYTRREFSSALGLLSEHARLFARGHLAEEREALRVRCLRLAGRADEAHRLAAEFAVRFPRSVLLAGIDSAENE